MAETSETTNTESRTLRKFREGEVVASKMAKTVVVKVERRFRHSRYKKVVTRYRKYYAHDEKGEARPGDRVRIEETRPISRLKSWRLVTVLASGGAGVPVTASGE
jgi:small subunit ribosomal protein S17